MSRFLFDQNAPLASVLRLREAGHDVAQVESGEPDSAVLERARLESRIVVTYDRDFGFLVFRTHMPLPPGIVYFRSQPATPESTALELLATLRTPGVVLEGRLTVASPVVFGSARCRRLERRPVRKRMRSPLAVDCSGTLGFAP